MTFKQWQKTLTPEQQHKLSAADHNPEAVQKVQALKRFLDAEIITYDKEARCFRKGPKYKEWIKTIAQMLFKLNTEKGLPEELGLQQLHKAYLLPWMKLEDPI